jgi:predicted ester cyclase
LSSRTPHVLRGAHQRALNKLWGGIARENREKARRLYEEGLGRGDLSLLKGMASEYFRDLRHGGRGEEGMERVVLRLRESFSDLVVSVDAQEVERDLVSTRLMLSGTDRGKGVMWYKPTGRRVFFSAEFVDRFWRDGQLVEHDGSKNTEGLLRQLAISRKIDRTAASTLQSLLQTDPRRLPPRICARKALPGTVVANFLALFVPQYPGRAAQKNGQVPPVRECASFRRWKRLRFVR